MFERFTDRARRVVVLAQEEARLLNHSYIGTEHILLGLIAEGEGVGAVALQQLGVDLPAARSAVGEIIGTSTAPAPAGHIPFTPRSKKVLELALREAVQLGHGYIGTEHILLGLIGEGEGVGAQILTRRGLTLSGVRTTVIQILNNPEIVRQLRATQGRAQPNDRFSPGLRHALDAAAALATDAPVVGSHHLLSVFADWDDLAASSVLDAGGFDRSRLEVPIAAWDVAGTRDETAEQWGARVTEVSTDDDAVMIRVSDPALRERIAQALGQGLGPEVEAALGQYLNAFKVASFSVGEAGDATQTAAAGGDEHHEEEGGPDEHDGGA